MIRFSKYIVVAVYGGHCEKIIIFDKDIKHKTMANLMKQAGYRTLVSAGFIDEFMQCYGESSSTGVSSRKERDTKILHETLGISDKRIDCIGI
jgi:hypothetical protein